MNLLKAYVIIAFCLAAVCVHASSGDSSLQLHTQGLYALKSGDLERAIALLSQAISMNSQEARYYNDRGVAYKRRGDLDKALADYTTAIQLKPGYTHALNNRGLAYLEQGKFDLAIADFSEAIKHGELQSRIYTNLGLAKAKQGDHQGAIKDFDKAFSYHPMDHRSFLFMAESLEKTGEVEKALRTYQLARNLLNDPETKAVVESRISQLETQRGLRPANGADPSNRAKSSSDSIAEVESRFADKPRPSIREIARAQPFPDSNLHRQRHEQPTETVIDSYHTLEEKSRNKAMGKYSGAAREIFRQGQEFVFKGDTAKALIRFEDARQMERRNKNVFGVAWSDLEIARIYRTLGDHVRADTYLKDALRLFEALKAQDEIILTLIELAETSKYLMEKEKTESFYQKARDKALALGYEAFAQEISAVATGQKPLFEKKSSAASHSYPWDTKVNGAKGKVAYPLSPPVAGNDPRQVKEASKAGSTASSAQPQPQSLSGATSSNEKPQAVETSIQSALKANGQSKTVDRKPMVFRVGPQAVTSKLTSPTPDATIRITKRTPSAEVPSTVKSETGLAESMQKQDKSQFELPAPPAARHSALGQGTKQIPKIAHFGTTANTVSTKAAPKEPSLQEDLTLLKELRKRNDEQQMIPVLERLGHRYFQTGDFQKSAHAYSAAIGLREKLGMIDGMESILESRAASKETLGNLSQAMEDLARSFYLRQNRGLQPDRLLMDRLSKISNTLGIDRDALLEAFQLLWNSRSRGDNSGELQALLTIARIYAKAGKFSQAITYYDLASALVTANKAQILEKMGDERLAEQQYSQALEAVKNLDYSAYIHIMKQSKFLGARAIH